MTDKATPGTNDRAAARKQQILDAAAAVFRAKGYHGASIRDIAQVAGVADGTIYNYFENKEGLLMAMLEAISRIEQGSRQLQGRSDTELEQAIAETARDYFARLARHDDLYRAVMPEIIATPALRQRYYSEFGRSALDVTTEYLAAHAARAGKSADDAAITSRILNAVFLGELVLRIMGDSELRPDADADEHLAKALARLFTGAEK